jgi:signal transduction histidine kinase
MPNQELKDYKKIVSKKLSQLNDFFSSVSIGNFDDTLKLPDKEDEFTELFVGIRLMQEVIKEKLSDLTAERDQLQSLIDNLPVGVFIAKAPSGRPLFTNKRAAEILGRGIDPNAGKEKYTTVYKTYKENGDPYSPDQLPMAVAIREKKQVVNRDVFIHKPDGTKLCIKTTITPVFNKFGDMVSAIGVFDDITKETELERNKSQFVSLSSHQLRTPLGSMRWTTEMLIKDDFGKLPKEAIEVLNDMHGSIIRLTTLVNNLLKVDRINEQGVLDLPETVDLTSILNKAIITLRPMASEKKISINLKSKLSKPISLKIDKNKLIDVFQNLLSNAIKYCNQNGKVEIFTKIKDTFVAISFKDNGIGISPADQKKIFTKFFRSEAAARKEDEGSGLGLFVVKSYVEAWGGQVSFESKEWEGSTFTVSLPLKPKLKTS